MYIFIYPLFFKTKVHVATEKLSNMTFHTFNFRKAGSILVTNKKVSV